MCSKLGVYILAGGPEGVKYTLWKPWPSVTSLPPLPLVVSGAPDRIICNKHDHVRAAESKVK